MMKLRSKYAGTALLVLFLALTSLGILHAETVQRQFEESSRFLTNPDCGWIAYNYEDSYDLRKAVVGRAKRVHNNRM